VITAVYTLLAHIEALASDRGDQDGQGLAEYALILALIAIISIVALLFLGSQISDQMTIIGNAV
jgi:Flp pilus assembly pilin Flp